MNSEETVTAELAVLFGCAGHAQAEIAWFMFGLGQLGVMSQVNPEQALLLIQAMRKDIDDLQDRTSDLIGKMEEIVASFESAIEAAIENQEESNENL